MYGDFGLYGWGMRLFPIIFGIIFLLFAVVIAVTLVRGLSQWNSNNRSPVLTVEAMVSSKRQAVSRRRQEGVTDTYTNITTYYATFQVESGDRMELGITGEEYGMLAEGDMGKLTFQGTRYLGFERGPLA